jgi:murein DD-endopeptidase MepM/ murein hydrolase activator NlpD
MTRARWDVVVARAMRLMVAVTALALLAGSGTAAIGADDLHDARDGAANRIQRAERRVGESSAGLAAATERLRGALARLQDAKAELAAMDTAVVAARERDQALRSDLRDAELRLNDARASLSSAVAAVADQEQVVVDTVVGLYQGDDPALLALSSLLNSASTEDLVRRQSATEVLLNKQARAYDTLRATQVLAEVGERRVEEGALEVATKQRAAAASLDDLKAVRNQARSAAQEVGTSVRQRRRARQRAERIRARDLAVLRRAEAEEALIRKRIRVAARRRAAQAAPGNDTSAAAADGFLMTPVAGSVSSPFGYRVHPIFKYWGLHDGIDYAAGCGQPLWAGATGVVTSKYYSDVYGYRLFVDVGGAGGKAITLVYNHAAAYSVGVGDRLRRGQVIGSVGDTGWSTGCHLHFTVLANGSPVDPEGWY